MLAVYSTYWSIKYGPGRFLSTPSWILLYLVPGYLSGYYMHTNWVTVSVTVGILGSVVWLIHAQLSIVNTGALASTSIHILVCVFGAWLGKRKAWKSNAL